MVDACLICVSLVTISMHSHGCSAMKLDGMDTFAHWKRALMRNFSKNGVENWIGLGLF
jgi:hypothetical protein